MVGGSNPPGATFFDRSYSRRVEDCEEKLEERANPRSHAWKGRFRRRLGKPVETV